jgi:hypothetical protein
MDRICRNRGLSVKPVHAEGWYGDRFCIYLGLNAKPVHKKDGRLEIKGCELDQIRELALGRL